MLKPKFDDIAVELSSLSGRDSSVELSLKIASINSTMLKPKFDDIAVELSSLSG
jgi:hypothetical protein